MRELPAMNALGACLKTSRNSSMRYSTRHSINVSLGLKCFPGSLN